MAKTTYKLLIDNNISVQIVEVLKVAFSGTQHVSSLNLSSASDTDIWNIAKDAFDAILIKDKDFYYRVSTLGSPPKVIWITRGNCRNIELIQLIRIKVTEITEFLNSNRELLIIS